MAKITLELSYSYEKSLIYATLLAVTSRDVQERVYEAIEADFERSAVQQLYWSLRTFETVRENVDTDISSEDTFYNKPAEKLFNAIKKESTGLVEDSLKTYKVAMQKSENKEAPCMLSTTTEV